MIIDGSIPEQMIREMIEDSYDLVVSKLPIVPSPSPELGTGLAVVPAAAARPGADNRDLNAGAHPPLISVLPLAS